MKSGSNKPCTGYEQKSGGATKLPAGPIKSPLTKGQ
jgi:hypothetical protein